MNYFAYPRMWLWLIVPLLLLGAYAVYARERKRTLKILGKPETLLRLLAPGLDARRRGIAAFYLAGLFCWVVALAGPLLGTRLVEFKHRGLDVFIAVDCSLSMQAEDFKPNRMEHAKFLLAQLIDQLAGNRLGIIAFAGQAFIQCPLTIDTYAAKQILETLDTGSVPVPGTAIGEALRTAIKGLQAGEGGSRVLILLTDGEDHRSDPPAAAKEAARIGMKIYAIGIGSDQGEPIPVMDDQGKRADYKRDKKGEVVLSRLDDKTLIQITQETGGRYWRATAGGGEIDQIVQTLSELKQGDLKARRFDRFENRYQWPLALGLLLLLIGLAIPEQGWKET